MPDEKIEEGLTLDKRTMDVLVANIIPTSMTTCRARWMISEVI